MEKLIISTEEQLRQIVQDSINSVLATQLPQKEKSDEKEPLLTREQMAKELHISLVTITDWMKKGLPYRRLNGRIYFLRSEVMESMKVNRLNTNRKS